MIADKLRALLDALFLRQSRFFRGVYNGQPRNSLAHGKSRVAFPLRSRQISAHTQQCSFWQTAGNR
ncbi:Uncharacterised protein [Vibrio cholerae]|nr:Uncharacterised protein [Vibrio cholerae]